MRDLGYSVIEATTPADALRIAREHAGPLDLLLADVVMPKMRGPELAEKVKELRPAIKVLFVSGYTDDASVGGALAQPGVALLAKPFKPDALAHKVRELLGNGNGH